MSVKIIIDSSTDVPKETEERLTVVPLTLRFGDEEFIDGITITHQQFYQKLSESDVLPCTSQATPDTFSGIYKKIIGNGDSAVVITISQNLSGTYQSAVIAAEDYPDRIFVVDSKSVTIGAGILTELALQLADRGMSAKEIATTIEKERENICFAAVVDTLEYLKKGGRISKTVAFAGGLLSIKPVICVKDGEISVLGKARGSKQANSALIAEIQKFGGIDFSKPLLLGYTGLDDTLLQNFIQDSELLWEGNTHELNQTVVGSIVGTHAGPGAVAVTFFKATEE